MDQLQNQGNIDNQSAIDEPNQESASDLQPIPDATPLGSNKLFFIIFIVEVLLLVGGYFGYRYLLNPVKITNEDKLISKYNLTEVYRNKKYGFEIRYPKDWKSAPQDVAEKYQAKGKEPPEGFSYFLWQGYLQGSTNVGSLDSLGIYVNVIKKNDKTPRQEIEQDQEIQDLYNQVKKQSPQAKVIGQSFSANGAKGYIQSLVLTDNNQIASNSIIVLDGKNWRYRFTHGNAILESPDRFEAIIKTFWILE